jgi:hypothetical protein
MQGGVDVIHGDYENNLTSRPRYAGSRSASSRANGAGIEGMKIVYGTLFVIYAAQRVWR